jgi:hypothetical protein
VNAIFFSQKENKKYAKPVRHLRLEKRSYLSVFYNKEFYIIHRNGKNKAGGFPGSGN